MQLSDETLLQGRSHQVLSGRVRRPCVGVHQAMALIGDDKQATGEEKSDLVETGLTGLAAMALFLVCKWKV